jgi:glycosyltransferase involved in cell wall biosynthesis
MMEVLVRTSIALCTYNGELYLQQQLDSILHQSKQPDEVIVCDDGSSDHTWEILQQFAEKAPMSVRLIQNDVNLGSTENFAKAMGLCSGDIILLADQDDYWQPNKIYEIVDVFQNYPATQMVFSDAWVVDEQMVSRNSTLWEVLGFNPTEQAKFHVNQGTDVLSKGNVVTGATMAVRKEMLGEVLPFVPCWVHDEWMAFIITACHPVRLIDKPLICYRQHGRQQIGCKEKSKFMCFREQLTDGSIRRCTGRVKKWLLAVKKLDSMTDKLWDKELPEILQERIEHWETRLSLAKNKLTRGQQIWHELEQYQRFETRLIALKDWFEG